MNTNRSTSKSPLTFFLLELALSIPTWVVMGAWPKAQLFPILGIPLSAIWALTPVIAALILVYRENRTSGMVELLKRPFDFKRIKSKAWFVPMMLLYPGIVFIQYGLGLFSGTQVPSPQLSFAVPLMFVGTFFWSLGEELGWTGYALDPMQERYGALKASILLGLVWAGLHVPMFLLAGRSPEWIVGQSFYIVASRVLFVWIYNNTGKSLFTQAILHASYEAFWLLFPTNFPSMVPDFYNPGLLAITTAILVAIVAFLWGSKTLAQYRYARLPQPYAKG